MAGTCLELAGKMAGASVGRWVTVLAPQRMLGRCWRDASEAGRCPKVAGSGSGLEGGGLATRGGRLKVAPAAGRLQDDVGLGRRDASMLAVGFQLPDALISATSPRRTKGLPQAGRSDSCRRAPVRERVCVNRTAGYRTQLLGCGQ